MHSEQTKKVARRTSKKNLDPVGQKCDKKRQHQLRRRKGGKMPKTLSHIEKLLNENCIMGFDLKTLDDDTARQLIDLIETCKKEIPPQKKGTKRTRKSKQVAA